MEGLYGVKLSHFGCDNNFSQFAIFRSNYKWSHAKTVGTKIRNHVEHRQTETRKEINVKKKKKYGKMFKVINFGRAMLM